MLYQPLPTHMPYREAKVRRRKMTLAWAQRREEMLSDCLVSPDVFTQMVDRLGEFGCLIDRRWRSQPTRTPCISTSRGCCPHVAHKNAEAIAAFVDVERQVIQDFIGTAFWDHRPLVTDNWLRVLHIAPCGRTWEHQPLPQGPARGAVEA